MVSEPRPPKIPLSVLVVIHTAALDVLLIRRADAPEHWQSVTGSKDWEEEDFRATAVREVMEETAIDATAPGCVLTDWGLENIYAIYPQWLHRYAPGVAHNTERIFGLQVPAGDAAAFAGFLQALAYPYAEETHNPAYKLFLG